MTVASSTTPALEETTVALREIEATISNSTPPKPKAGKRGTLTSGHHLPRDQCSPGTSGSQLHSGYHLLVAGGRKKRNPLCGAEVESAPQGHEPSVGATARGLGACVCRGVIVRSTGSAASTQAGRGSHWPCASGARSCGSLVVPTRGSWMSIYHVHETVGASSPSSVRPRGSAGLSNTSGRNLPKPTQRREHRHLSTLGAFLAQIMPDPADGRSSGEDRSVLLPRETHGDGGHRQNRSRCASPKHVATAWPTF